MIKLDEKLLGDAIIQLLNNEQKCQDFGNAGFNLVMNTCNSTKMGDNILKLYKQLVNDNKFL